MTQVGENFTRSEKQVLVVDDDPAVRTLLIRVLSEEGYSVWPAADGTDALNIFGVLHLDLVLLDLGLPDMSGWEVFESLALREPMLPVIVLTAMPNQAAIATGAGAGAFFEKPLDFNALLNTVSGLLAEPPKSRLARMARRTPAPVPPHPGD